MSSSQAGPSRPTQRAQAPPVSSASPLPQPIRRAARAAQAVQTAQAQAQSQRAQIPPAGKPSPRSKSLLSSFTSLSPNTRIVIGLVGLGVGVTGLLVDRFVLPQEEEAKPLISVRTVDRE